VGHWPRASETLLLDIPPAMASLRPPSEPQSGRQGGATGPSNEQPSGASRPYETVWRARCSRPLCRPRHSASLGRGGRKWSRRGRPKLRRLGGSLMIALVAELATGARLAGWQMETGPQSRAEEQMQAPSASGRSPAAARPCLLGRAGEPAGHLRNPLASFLLDWGWKILPRRFFLPLCSRVSRRLRSGRPSGESRRKWYERGARHANTKTNTNTLTGTNTNSPDDNMSSLAA